MLLLYMSIGNYKRCNMVVERSGLKFESQGYITPCIVYRVLLTVKSSSHPEVIQFISDLLSVHRLRFTFKSLRSF